MGAQLIAVIKQRMLESVCFWSKFSTKEKKSFNSYMHLTINTINNAVDIFFLVLQVLFQSCDFTS